MKQSMIALALVILISLPLLAGNVTGVVSDGTTNAPVANARVQFHYFDPESVIVGVVYTDVTGAYILENVPEHTYYVICRKEGYVTTYLRNIYVPSSGLQLDVSINLSGDVLPPSPPPTPPEVPPTDTLFIIGKIQSQNFAPIPNANISWKMTSTSTEYTTSSDANGLYALVGMKEGSYEVDVNSSGYQSLSFSTYLSAAKSEQIIFMSSATSVDGSNAISIPKTIKLYEAYPTPFNPSTTIRFIIPERGIVTLRVFDNLGREVAMLANGEFEGGVEHQVTFNASNLTSGVYFSRLEFMNQSVVKKLLLVK
jgi:hypothetical protein